jgi:hypothetical protein
MTHGQQKVTDGDSARRQGVQKVTDGDSARRQGVHVCRAPSSARTAKEKTPLRRDGGPPLIHCLRDAARRSTTPQTRPHQPPAARSKLRETEGRRHTTTNVVRRLRRRSPSPVAPDSASKTWSKRSRPHHAGSPPVGRDYPVAVHWIRCTGSPDVRLRGGEKRRGLEGAGGHSWELGRPPPAAGSLSRCLPQLGARTATVMAGSSDPYCRHRELRCLPSACVGERNAADLKE